MVHVDIYPDLYNFSGHLKLSCQGKTPSKGRYKFQRFSNTFGHSLIFDVRKTKRMKNNGFDGNDIIIPRYRWGGVKKIVKSS